MKDFLIAIFIVAVTMLLVSFSDIEKGKQSEGKGYEETFVEADAVLDMENEREIEILSPQTCG